MSFIIENLTSALVLVRCNSGTMLHLAPRKKSEEILDVEVKDNPKVQKLQDQHVIALYQVRKEGQPSEANSVSKISKSESVKQKK
jgi:hypothetical protein